MNQKFIKLPAKSIVLKKLYKISIISIPKSQKKVAKLKNINYFNKNSKLNYKKKITINFLANLSFFLGNLR